MMNVARSAVYDSGFIPGWGTEDEFWKWMRDGSGLEGSDTELTQRVLDGFVLRPWMMDWVRHLNAQGYATGILSDQSHWLDRLNERDHFFEFFDHVFNSYHMGEGKRNPALFPGIAEQLALSSDEILLVDDMKSNLERAKAAVWQTVHYATRRIFCKRLKIYWNNREQTHCRYTRRCSLVPDFSLRANSIIRCLNIMLRI
jgi:putative hydrolase of the HAD superfamily